MFDRDNQTTDNSYVVGDGSALESGLNAYMTKVFGLMFMGLALTALAAGGFVALVATNPSLGALASNGVFVIALIVLEFGLVIAITAGLNKMNALTARFLFLLYAVVNGVTLSYVLFAYAGAPWVITKAFIMTAVFFGTMCVYGMVTKADLTHAGKIFIVGLIAIVIASVVNMFLRSSGLDYILCIAGIAVFTGLTAYDVQKLKRYYFQSAGDETAANKMAIFGALQLYLDFINLFLYLVRFFGRNK